MNPTFATGMIDSQYQATPPWDETILNKSSYNWDYQRRSMQSTWDRQRWTSLWPRGRTIDAAGYYPDTMMFGGGPDGSDYFEPPSCGGSGTQTTKFIRGTTYDSGGAVLANAVVQGFVTTTETYVGAVTSAEDGTYSLPTNNLASVTHYVVAYKAGAPDVAGTTVNTLLPTNIDGT